MPRKLTVIMTGNAHTHGPALFLAQFRDYSENPKAPFDGLENICRWAAEQGFTGAQLPSWDGRLIDLKQAAESAAYCDDLVARIISYGLKDGITELATHIQGQLMAVHPAYTPLFAGFAPDHLADDIARYTWASEQLKLAIRASHNLRLKAMPSFTGSFLWPYIYPWPQRPAGLVEFAFEQLAERWLPILDLAGEHGVSVAYELHPGEDVHDGFTFDRFLTACRNHKAVGINFDPSHFVLMGLDYLSFIHQYAPRITAYHVKDAELLKDNARAGFYSSFEDWKNRMGRFRSLGDGEVDFEQIELAFRHSVPNQENIARVLEWECCFKGKRQGAREGAPFIKALLNGEVLPTIGPVEPHSDGAFDDFAKTGVDKNYLRQLIGLPPIIVGSK